MFWIQTEGYRTFQAVGSESSFSKQYLYLLADGFLSKASIQTPICNRCHDLLHHNAGAPIEHPTLQSIHEIISESPHKYNHIYHVLDAADFPLSLIPQLQRYLSLSRQRSRNRRAKTSRFYHGRKAELSFIITRSDLLAPKKEQVDKLMPYLIEVLRDALGASAKDFRLGNVHCVSSKRGWWTANLKEDIWNRGGGGWMVGKVNVGKSNLFECVFPKGRNEKVNFTSSRGTFVRSEIQSGAEKPRIPAPELKPDLEHDILKEDMLLPPAQVEQAFPVMPVVSSLPGTTASPIRLPFGGGRGELIDLPGLRRSDLETYVADEHKSELVMQQRLKPEQYVLKPGQSLLLGNLIRITPKSPGVTVLAYPYVPFPGHVTSTEKAIEIHTQRRDSCIPSIVKPGVGGSMSTAGTFQLKWDVTNKRVGPLTAPMAVGLKAEVLPFKVFSMDLLIEGCGWVELVAQIRKRDLEPLDSKDDCAIRELFPAVEVFSPEGRHIGARQPMNAWLLGGRKQNSRRVRPRRSMKGVKRRTKLETRRERIEES